MTLLTERLWSVSVTDLMKHFRNAMLAIIPVADAIHMSWREPDNYDDWDLIASAFYESILIGSIRNAIQFQGSSPVLKYDIRTSSYTCSSFIGLAGFQSSAAFVCLETDEHAFDTCLFKHLDINGLVTGEMTVKFDATEFVVVARKVGASVIIDQVDVLL